MHVRLMADYECYPLWAGDAPDYLDPWRLDLSSELAASITTWGEAYDATLNRDNPAASGFGDAAAAKSWLLTGRHLAARLRDEGLTVDYAHESQAAQDLVART